MSYGYIGVNTNLVQLTSGATMGTFGATTTEGPYVRANTNTTASAFGGFRQANSIVNTAGNLMFRFRFRVNQVTTNNRFWLGIANLAATNPTTDTPLNGGTYHGMLFGYPLGGVDYTVLTNNGGGTEYDNLASATGFPTNAPDTNWHTVILATTNNGTNFTYSLDGAAPFTLSTQLPSNIVLMGIYGGMTNTSGTAVNCTWDLQYGYFTTSANNL